MDILFCFIVILKPSYWKIQRVRVQSTSIELEKKTDSAKGGFETDPDGLDVAISIRNMTKVF